MKVKIKTWKQMEEEFGLDFINSLYWDSVLCELLNEETLKEMETLLNKTKNT